jgi:hypothetical protein
MHILLLSIRAAFEGRRKKHSLRPFISPLLFLSSCLKVSEEKAKESEQ